MKITEVIKTEMERGTFVCKYPNEDFNTHSQLIVQQSQEALLFANGEACDLFEPGKYTLETGNIPILKKLLNLPTGGESPFHCVVYFINKTEQMNLYWGIRDVNFLDATNNDYAFKIGASGEMSICISDARKLIMKLVGTQTALDRETLMNFFKAPIIKSAKEILPNTLRADRISIFELESSLSKLSEKLKQQISSEMADYGISLEKFWVQNIVKPENDPFYITLNKQRGQEITIANQGKLDAQKAQNQVNIEMIHHSAEMTKQRDYTDVKAYDQQKRGYSFSQEQLYEVLGKMAENQSAGGVMEISKTTLELAAGFGMAGTMNNMFRQSLSEGMNATTQMTQHMNATMLGQNNEILPEQNQNGSVSPEMTKNAIEPAEPVQSNVPQQQQEADSVVKAFTQKVQMLNAMREMLSDEEFAKQKQELLDEIRGTHQ